MGQYYKPVFLKSATKSAINDDLEGWFYSHSHREKVTREDGTSFMSGTGLKLMEHSWLGNRFVGNVERNLIGNPKHLVWAGDYAEKELDVLQQDEDGKLDEYNLYDLCRENATKEIKASVRKLAKKYRYLVNHTQKVYVDKKGLPEDADGWCVHPLPLLTCEGDGSGGGDFTRDEDKRNPNVGKWARDLISVETQIPEGFTELKPDFRY